MSPHRPCLRAAITWAENQVKEAALEMVALRHGVAGRGKASQIRQARHGTARHGEDSPGS